MEGLILFMLAKVHPMASLFSLSTFNNFFPWSSVSSDVIITGKASLGSKNTYLRKSGKGFNSKVGSEVYVPEEGGSEERKGRESISSQFSSSTKLPAHESLQAYTSSQLTLSNSSIIAGCLCRLKIFNSTVMFPKDNLSIPFLQLIKAFEVARKGRPRMTGI